MTGPNGLTCAYSKFTNSFYVCWNPWTRCCRMAGHSNGHDPAQMLVVSVQQVAICIRNKSRRQLNSIKFKAPKPVGEHRLRLFCCFLLNFFFRSFFRNDKQKKMPFRTSNTTTTRILTLRSVWHWIESHSEWEWCGGRWLISARVSHWKVRFGFGVTQKPGIEWILDGRRVSPQSEESRWHNCACYSSDDLWMSH